MAFLAANFKSALTRTAYISTAITSASFTMKFSSNVRSAWTARLLNAALLSFEDTMTEVVRLAWQIVNSEYIGPRARVMALKKIREAHNAVFEELFDAPPRDAPGRCYEAHNGETFTASGRRTVHQERHCAFPRSGRKQLLGQIF
jgi:hypothetical protein